MTDIDIHLITLHNAQKQVLNESKRFNVLRIGRRWGKTELAKELSINTMLDGQVVGYWTPTYKDLAEIWNEVKHTLTDIIKTKNEQLKSITLITGGRIDFWSMEDPNSGRGRKYHRAIIDEAEKARNFQEAWGQAIRPTLADYKGDCWILSTPKGKKTFFTELTEKYPPKYDNWASWTLSTYTNPYIAKEELELMKVQMNDYEFRQEIMAESLDQNASAFCFNFSDKNIGKTEWKPDLETYLSFDFNLEPLTCIVAQKPDFNKMHIIREFVVNNVDIEEICQQILAEYPNALFRVTGDQTGENATALVKGLTYYNKIKDLLQITSNQLTLPGKNPLHKISRLEVNMLLGKCEIIFDEDNCKDSIWDCKNVEYDPEKKKIVKEDRTKTEQKSDLLDCFTGDTLITTEKGNIPIKDVQLNDKVLTTNGFNPVINKWSSEAIVYEFTLTDGTKIKCTKDHKFYVHHIGWYPIFSIFEQNYKLCKLHTGELSTVNTQNNPISIAPKARKEIREAFTGKNGLINMELFQKALISTIKTRTLQTIISRIWELLKAVSTGEITWLNELEIILSSSKSWLRKVGRQLKYGMAHQMVLTDIDNMQKDSSSGIGSMMSANANNAEKNTNQETTTQGFVVITANPNGGYYQESTMRQGNAYYVKQISLLTDIQKLNTAQGNVHLKEVGIKEMKRIGKRKVYDITVEGEHEFFANKILAHNCFRYLCHTFMRDELTHLGL